MLSPIAPIANAKPIASSLQQRVGQHERHRERRPARSAPTQIRFGRRVEQRHLLRVGAVEQAVVAQQPGTVRSYPLHLRRAEQAVGLASRTSSISTYGDDDGEVAAQPRREVALVAADQRLARRRPSSPPMTAPGSESRPPRMIAGSATSATIQSLPVDARRRSPAACRRPRRARRRAPTTARTRCRRVTPWASAASWSKAAARIARPVPGVAEEREQRRHEHGQRPAIVTRCRCWTREPEHVDPLAAPTGRDRPGVEADEAAGDHPDRDVDAEGDDRDHEHRPADHRPDRDPLDRQREHRGQPARRAARQEEGEAREHTTPMAGAT